MILLYDYGITANNYSYIVGKVHKRKNGGISLYDKVYPNTLVQCLKHIYKKREYDLVSNNDLSLLDAISQIEKLQNDFTNKLLK